MQPLSWIQRKIGQRPAPQAWGLSMGREGCCLVELGRDASRFLGVLRVEHLPGALDDPGPAGVSQGLRQCAKSQGLFRASPRVHVGMAMAQVVHGTLLVPVGLGPAEREAEVQLEAARSLNLEPEHISFDWQASALSDDTGVPLHWMACPQSAIDVFSQCVRRSGWRLASVEPELQAAQRAADCLCGGLSSVLTRPVQDWQFDPAMGADSGLAEAAHARAVEPALRDALQTPAGPRLVATGLALKAWT